MTQVMKTCLLLGTLLLSLCLFAPVRGEAASEARQALESTINQVLVELQKPGLHDPAERKGIEDNIERIVLTLFSFEELSMRTVGPNWKNFTEDQQKRFMDAFEDLLRERYTDALEGYNGGTVTYLKETPVGSSGNRVQIDTLVIVNNKDVSVSYRMQREKDGSWVVYDIIIEGVGMVQNYRSQFQSVLQRGNAEELITLVRARADEMRDAKAKNRQSKP